MIGVALLALAGPKLARAAEPEAALEGPARALEAELDARAQDNLSAPPLALTIPGLAALQPAPASLFAPSVLAKRSRDREFDTSLGESDPRVRSLPRTHRFRLTLHAQWVKLTRTQNPSTGEFERFHFAPMMLDLGYQAQFLKYVMVRLAVAAGGNVANTRNAMPMTVFPQAYVGFQHKIIGLAFGYGFDWTIPPTFGASANTSTALEQPVITRNHVVMGEISATSRIDKVALTLGLTLGGIQSDLTHFETYNRKFRFYLGLQFGAFFDGTKRREKKARKKAEAEGR
ncbi:hypothetical protein [Enhygromyxa salina]|uniref:hypothetical protein n=1 Tax=Enhygromyxa salina TaxID=215803 RepID=UPI000D08F792|nr:hypothetical protein [Enhygromyxa salina]